MSDEQNSTSVSVEERAQSREELIHLLLEGEDWAGLDAMTSHLSNLDDERSQEEAAVLVRHLLASLSKAKSDSAKARLRFLVGQIYHRILNDANLAVSNYRLAVQYDPNLADAFRAGADLYFEHGRLKAVYQLRSLEHSAVTSPERMTELLVELIGLAGSALDDPIAAYRWAMKLDTLHDGHEVARETMTRLEAVAGESAVRYSAAIDESKTLRDRKARAQFLLGCARDWHDKNAKDPWIIELLGEVVRQDGRNEEAHGLLEHILNERELWLELGQYLSKRLQRTPRKSDKIELLKRLAALAVSHLADADQACQWYRHILRLSPLDRDALNFCVDHYSQTEDWSELVSVYEAALRTRQRGGEESAMLIQIALTLWKKMGDWERAEGYFRRIKLSEPKHVLMLKFYEAYYQERQDYRRLLSVLSTQQSNEDGIDKKIEVGLRMALVAEQELGSNEKAIDIYRSILKLDPDQSEARAGLPALFVATRKWNALLEHLKDELNRLPGKDVLGQVEVLNEIVQVYRDRLRLPAMVVSTYQQILDVDPANLEASEELEQTFRKSGRWNDLIGLLTRRVERLYLDGASERSADLSREIARLWIDKFSNHSQAAQHLERIVDIQEDDVESLDLLTEIYEQKHDWQMLFDVLQKKVEFLEATERVDTLVRMAEIAVQRLEMVDEGIELWRTVKEEQPERGDQALDILLERYERYDELVEVYLERLTNLTGAKRVTQLKQLIPILMDRLGDEERAEEALNDILETEPNDAFAEAKLRDRYVAAQNWNGLEVLYGSREKWHALLSVLSASADNVVDEVESSELLKRMARICEESLDNRVAAMECWERLLTQQPTHPEALQVLAPYYESEGRWTDFVEIKEAQLDPDDGQYTEGLVRLSHIYSEHLDDDSKALERVLSALNSMPTRVDLLQPAMRYASTSGRFEELYEACTYLVDQVTDEELAYLRVVADVGAEKLERYEEVVPYFERILELDQADVSAVNELCAIYEKLGRWDDLQNAYERALEFVTGSAREAELLASLAHLSADVIGDMDAAKQAYERILSADSKNLVALQGLESIAVQTADQDTVEFCLTGQIPLLDDPLEVAHIRERLARLYIDKGAHHEAFDEIALAADVRVGAASIQACLFDLVSTDVREEACALLERVLIETEESNSLAVLYDMMLEGLEGSEQRAALSEKLGVLKQEKLSDPPGALQSFVETLVFRPEDDDIHTIVKELALFTENLEALRNAYERLAIGGPDMPENADVALKYSDHLVDLLDAEFDDLLGVRRVIEDASALHGDSLPRLGRLEACLSRLEDWHALAEVKARQVAVAGDGELKVDMLRELARLSEDRLVDHEAAYQSWAGIEQLRSLDPEAVEAMTRLLTGMSDWQRLRALYEKMYASTVPPVLSVGLEFAKLCQQTDDFERAVSVYQTLVEGEIRTGVSSALSACVDDARSQGSDETHVRSAAELLAVCLEDESEWLALKDTLQLVLELTDGGAHRLAVRRRIVLVCLDHLDETALGCKMAVDGLVEDGPCELLYEVLNETGANVLEPAVLAEYLRGAIESDSGDGLSPTLRRAWLDTACETLGRLEEDALALSFAIERSDLDPEDVELLNRLSLIQARLGDFEGQRDVLERQFELSQAPDRKLSLGTELIGLLTIHLDDSEDALRIASVLVEELESVPFEVVEMLEARLVDKSLYVELADFAELVASRISTPEQRCAYLRKAGDIHIDLLNDPTRGAQLLERALETGSSSLALLQRLEQLFEQEGIALKQLNVIEQQLKHLDDVNAQAQVQLRIGVLCADSLSEFERSVDALEIASSSDETRGQAVEALTRLLHDRHEAIRVARILWSQQDQNAYRSAIIDALEYLRMESEVPSEKIRASLEYGLLIEADDQISAFQSIADAYRLSKGEAEIELELERVALATNHEGAYLNELVAAVEQGTDRNVGILIKAAAFAELNLEDPDAAVSLYRDVLEREPGNVVANEGLEYLLEGQGAFSELASFLQERAHSTGDEALRQSLLQRAAELMDEELSDAESSILVWQEVYESTGSDAAFSALERLYRATLDWRSLLILLSERAEGVESDEIGGFYIRIIDVIVSQLEDGDGALETIQSALSITEDPELFNFLKRLFLNREKCDGIELDRGQLAILLGPRIPEDDGETRYECYLAQAETSEESSTGQLDSLRAAAGEMITLERYDEAYTLYARCFESTLSELDADALRALEAAPLRAKWYQLLGELVSDARVEDDVRLGRLFELSLLAVDIGDDAQEERRWLLEILEFSPVDKRAQYALCNSYRREQEWEALAAALLDFAERETETSDKLEYLYEACTLTEEVLADPEQAIMLWSQVRETDAANQRALDAMERLLVQTERYEDLVEFYLEQMTEQSGESLAALRHRAGVALIDKLSRVDDGVEQLVQNLDGEVVHQDSLEVLESLMADVSFTTYDDHVCAMVLSTLATLYASTERWSDWFIVRELLADRTERVDEKVEILLSVVVQQGLVETSDVAFETLKRLFLELPEHESVYGALSDFCAEHDTWVEFAGLVEDALEEHTGLSCAEVYLVRLLEVYKELDEPTYRDRIEHVCVRLLSFEDCELSALRCLVELNEHAEAWAQCIKWYTRLMEHADVDESAADGYLRIADYHARSSSSTGQLDALRCAFESAPESLQILEKMIDLRESAQEYDEMVSLLQERIELSSDDDRVVYLERLAQLQSNVLDRADDAIRTLEEFDSDLYAHENLVDLYELLLSEQSQWDSLATFYETRLSSEDSAVERAELGFKVASLYALELDRDELAVEHLSAILQTEHVADRALQLLSELISRPDAGLNAFRELDGYYAMIGDTARRIEIMYQVLKHLEDDDDRLSHFQTLSNLLVEEAGPTEAAFHALAQAFLLDSNDVSRLEQLTEWSAALDLDQALRETLESALLTDVEPEWRTEYIKRLARLCQRTPDGAERGLQLWQEVLLDEEYNEEALSALDVMYTEAQDWERLLDVLGRLVDVIPQDQATNIRIRLGRLLEVVGSDEVSAIEQHQLVLAEEPTNQTALAELERLMAEPAYQEQIARTLAPIYRETNAFEKLAVLLEIQVQSADEVDRASLLRESGLIRLRSLNELALAEENLIAAYGLEPTSELNIEAFFELVEQAGVSELFAETLEAGLEQQEAQREKQQRLLLVDWYLGPLQDEAKAETTLRTVLELDAEDVETLTRLQLLLEDQERWVDVIELLRRQIELSADDGERLSVMINAGGICESYLTDTSAAIEFYQMAYALDPQTPEVFDHLEACITRQGDMLQLSQLLEERLKTIYDTATLVRTYDALIELYSNELNEPERAIDALEKRIEHETDDSAVDRLHSLYTNQAHWHRLVESLNELIAQEATDNRQLVYLETLISISEDKLKDLEQTRIACQQFLELGHRSDTVVSRLAGILRQQEDWDELVLLYESELEGCNELNIACGLRQGLVELYLNQREDIDAASSHLEYIVEHDDSTASRRLLAQLKSRQGHVEDALSLLNGLADLSDVSDDEMALIQRDLGVCLLEIGTDIESAITAFEDSFSLDSEVSTLRLIIQAARQLDDLGRLVRALDSAVAFFEDAERLSTLRELTALRLRNEEVEEAASLLEELVIELPDDIDVIRQLMACLETLGRTDELKRRYAGWIAEFGNRRMSGLTAEISFKLACLHREAGALEKAIGLFESVARLDSSNVPNLLALGGAFSDQERWDDTAKTLSTAVLYQDQMNATDRLSLFKLLGRAREERGETDKAKQMYRRALVLAPKDDNVKKRLERLREV
jgi:golgin subfamily B member 1